MGNVCTGDKMINFVLFQLLKMKNIRHISAAVAALFISFSISLFFPFSIKAQKVLSESDYFIEGIRYYNIEEFEKAETLFIKALEKNSDNDAACYYLALTYYGLRNVDKAEMYLKMANDIDPNNFWYRIRLAQLYSDTNRLEVALPLYEALICDYPSKSSLYYQIIDLYTSNNQIDKAMETLDKIESLRGKNEATCYARYELLSMQKKDDEAAKYLEDFYKIYPSPRAAYILGDIYKSKYMDSTAISFYEKALSMDPSYSPAYFGLAETYRMGRQLPLFFKNIYKFFSSDMMNISYKVKYMKEIVLNPQFVQTFTPQVDTMVTCIVNAHPGDSVALFMAGSYYIQTLRQEEGKAMYLECLHHYPEDIRANIEYISLLYYLKEWNTLIDQTKLSINTFPEDISLKEILGVALWQNKNYDEAISIYQSMIDASDKDDPLRAGYYAAIGDLYHEMKLSQKSYSYYEKALKINPDYNPVLNNYAYYLSLEGKKLKKAAQMSKKTIKSEPDNPTYLDTYAWILYLMGEKDDAKGYLKHAMLYGGKESAAILDHYADVLFSLKEYDLAFIYWEQADKMDSTLGISEKIKNRKAEIKK